MQSPGNRRVRVMLPQPRTGCRRVKRCPRTSTTPSSSSSSMELIVIGMILLLLLGALFVIPRSNRKGKAQGTHPTATTKTIRTYTKEEVSLHNTRTDCWIIVKDKVYNVTPYVEEHPGGDAILNNAGGDSTEGFYGKFSLFGPRV
ncbi:Cyt-b5 [Musa troglodytarum]|uniref:Cyt-b5 n=1 Tax=Musa troglodytarum TaxID=320322 RepID=A0A9E7HN75_9LILI|nr:Cyt-b5 [Musa troglodytarum]